MRMVFFSLLASSFFRKCVRVTNVEAHAAHYRMANIILNSSPRQHRRGERATHTERRRKVSSRPGKEAQSGPGATTLLRARPVDSSRVIPASEFVSSGRRFLGMEESLATRCRRCGATDANARRARLCYRSGARVNHDQLLVHALSRTVKRMSIRHQVESGATFNADRDLRKGICDSRGEAFEMLRHRSSIATERYSST